jgi:hypothetical protein
MLDLLNSEDFGFWVPMTIIKSSTTGKGKDQRRWIEGIASTFHLDLQMEKVVQAGIDYTYFLKYGFFNNDHKPGFENKIGEPVECRVTKEGLYVKGYLYNNHKVADGVWELAHAMESSGSSRQLGFSVQGKVLRRAGKTILKCWVQDIAITAAPINTNTWMDVVKALTEIPADMWCDEKGCYPFTPELFFDKSMQQEARSSCKCGGKSCGKADGGSCCSKKGGLAIPEEKMDLFKDGKALGVAGGHPLVPESLEGDKKINRDPLDQRPTGDWPAREGSTIDKAFTLEECVALVQQHRSLPRPEAQVVAKAIFNMNGITA